MSRGLFRLVGFLIVLTVALCGCTVVSDDTPDTQEETDLPRETERNHAVVCMGNIKNTYLLDTFEEASEWRASYLLHDESGSLLGRVTLYLPCGATAGSIYSFDDPAGTFDGMAGVVYQDAVSDKTYYALYDAGNSNDSAFAIVVDQVADGVLTGRFAADFNHSDGRTGDPFAISESSFSIDLKNHP